MDTLVLDNLFYERASSEVQQVCRVSCSIWFLTFILIEWMLFFFLLHALQFRSWRQKYIYRFFSLSSRFLCLVFFSRNRYNPLFYVYYLLICFCCSVLFLLSNTRYSLRSFFVHLFLTCKCVCFMCIYGSVCVCVWVFIWLFYLQMVCCW